MHGTLGVHGLPVAGCAPSHPPKEQEQEPALPQPQHQGCPVVLTQHHRTKNVTDHSGTPLSVHWVSTRLDVLPVSVRQRFLFVGLRYTN